MSTSKKILITPYNPLWPQQFEAESISLRSILGANCLAVHHIGSTAIPGLSAKPRLDIIIEAAQPQSTIKPLELAGYEYMGAFNIPLHYGFRRRKGTEVNLHVYPAGHPEIELNLTFRDYLRAHPHVKTEYQQIKTSLADNVTASQPGTHGLSNYAISKGEFIRNALNHAGFTRLRVVQCTDSTEWSFIQAHYAYSTHDECNYFILYKGGTPIGFTIGKELHTLLPHFAKEKKNIEELVNTMLIFHNTTQKRERPL